MAYKIVGADENSDFPPRVETKLASKFASTAAVSAAQNAAIQAANTYTDNQIANIEVPAGVTEDPNDPGFFI